MRAVLPGFVVALLVVACAASAPEVSDSGSVTPVDLPVDFYRCATASDCAIAGSANGASSVISRKYLLRFAERYGDCDNCTAPELACEHGICREEALPITSSAYRDCEQPADCAIGLDPCAQPVALNRFMLSQYRALSHVTPFHCRRIPERTPVAVACEAGQCSVTYRPSEIPEARMLSAAEVSALQQWQPYIRHSRNAPMRETPEPQQQPVIGVAKPSGTGKQP
ncbi:MAG: hypothetical protein KJO54_09710 [Gammaproteobacteria bacterium]|nr:hypothetical protein [Gammaproteobacteria bacterium]NNF61770.1 hypothetical protein [Gammaproteobacteria bacterium]NNM20435.1 hypothetical protein [Gammaproteobacteria bacterium]